MLCQKLFIPLQIVLSATNAKGDVLRGGAEVARQAHNLKVRGSIPLPATALFSGCRYWIVLQKFVPLQWSFTCKRVYSLAKRL